MIDCSSLLCHEVEDDSCIFNSGTPISANGSGRDEEEDEGGKLFLPWAEEYLPAYDKDVDDTISYLIAKEGFHTPERDYLNYLDTHILDRTSRQNAVDWVLKVYVFFRFSPVTAVLAVNYIDRFLSRYQKMEGKGWMSQLLSVACLSLAAKVEESEVPLLLDLQDGEAEYVFEPRTIQRMELMVLTTLEWRMSSVTPFSYIHKLISILGFQGTSRICLLARITDLIVATLKDIRFLDYRASTIATSALLSAIEDQFPLLFTQHNETLFLHPLLCKDACMSCCKLMYKLYVEPYRIKRSHYRIEPGSPLRVLDASFSMDSESSSANNNNNNNNNNNTSDSILSPLPASKKRRTSPTVETSF